jgi:hypothetical protein
LCARHVCLGARRIRSCARHVRRRAGPGRRPWRRRRVGSMAAAARGKAGAGLQEGARPASGARVARRVGLIDRVFMGVRQTEQSGMPAVQVPLRWRWLAHRCADTSYRLHWFPFEITRCANLKRSTVSTRALYGNFKYRPPFPKLPQLHDSYTPTRCSVCDSPFGDSAPLQYWVSLGVATDVLPLLVHACSRECLSRIPTPPEAYFQKPHQGGLALSQPPTRW